MAKKSRSGGFGKLFLGFVLGVIAVVGAAYAWLHYGKPPESFRQAALPLEKKLGQVASHRPLEHEKKVPPFGISEDVFEGGAKVYHKRCVSCHGAPGRDAPSARRQDPAPSQLWKHSRDGVTGVSDQDPGEIYSKIANGIRSSGMPPFKGTLSDTEIWQVSLLLKNANQEIPDPIEHILRGK
jgi:mono/diheme cytochrome c family protein